MGLIYRGETRFDLKGAIPVKLPLILYGQEQIICRVDCSQAKKSWRIAGTLEQLAFFPASGMVTIASFSMPFSEDKLLDLRVNETSYLRFIPVKWLLYRTNIIVSTIDMPVSFPAINIDPTPSNDSSIARVQVLNIGVSLLPANPLRKGYTLFNNGASPVYVGDSSNVNTTDSFFLRIPVGGFYESPTSSVYTGAIWAISTGESFVQAHEFGILAV